jgi:predicted transposase/invertase (TIGR01784 family)
MNSGIEIISLAILTDDDEKYRPNEYHFERWGFEHRMKIPMVKTVDYKIKKELIEKLDKSKNPMALAVKVQLKSRENRNKDVNENLKLKVELMREYYKNGYDRQYIRSLFRFLDSIIRLPEKQERQFGEEILKMEEVHNMAELTSLERIAKKDGKKEGRKEGRKEGKMEEKYSIARELLKLGISVSAITKATGLSAEEIEKLSAKGH